MKIDDKPITGDVVTRMADPTEAVGAKARTRKPDTHQRQGDQVRLSPRAREYQKARQALSALPDTDRDKIQEIKDRLHTGRYRIQTDKIAEKMLHEALNSED